MIDHLLIMYSWLDEPRLLMVWVGLMLVSQGVLHWDLRHHNSHLMPLMKAIWRLTVLYAGPLALAIYYYSGRKEIPKDTLWRRGFRSVSHCYAGCGLGEIVGLLIAIELLALGNWGIIGVTFTMAFMAGYALTIFPLMQDGVSLKRALRDALYSETLSIAVMEVVAISVDRWLGGNAGITEVRFWTSMLISLSLGLLAAYPVNVWLIHRGIKEGMHSPNMEAASDSNG
jgi:hypothetical protein